MNCFVAQGRCLVLTLFRILRVNLVPNILPGLFRQTEGVGRVLLIFTLHESMSGMIQSEYRYPSDAWPLVVAAVRVETVVEQENTDKQGRVCFLKIKRSYSDQSGVLLDLITERKEPGQSGLLVAMHWLLKSPGPDENTSRLLAVRIDKILKSNGAVCCHSPV